MELFKECGVFRENLEGLYNAPIKKLNWEILPKGKRPWSKIRSAIKPIIKNAKRGNASVISHRLETINGHGPNFHAVGTAGFNGYIVMGFTENNLYLFESIFHGNATYVFGNDWKRLSKMTKAQILNKKLQKDRVIHREHWEVKIGELLQ